MFQASGTIADQSPERDEPLRLAPTSEHQGILAKMSDVEVG
jgi:hypothetical protein